MPAAFVVVIVLVMVVVLGDSADTGSAGVSSWTCSLKSVASLPYRSTTVYRSEFNECLQFPHLQISLEVSHGDGQEGKGKA